MAFTAEAHFTLVNPGIHAATYFPILPISANTKKVVEICLPIQDGDPYTAISKPIHVGEGILAQVEVTPSSAFVTLTDPNSESVVATTVLEEDPTASIWVESLESRLRRQSEPATKPQMVYLGDLEVK